MKKLLMVLALTASSMAFADHSLKDAMNMDASFAQTINDTIAAKRVYCNLEESLQLKVKGYQAMNANRQVALCYDTKEALQKEQEMLKNGNPFGTIYGLSASSILTVEYKRKDVTDGSTKVSILKLTL